MTDLRMRLWAKADSWAAVSIVAIAGVALVVAAANAATGDTSVTLAATFVVAAAFFAIMVAGWVNRLAILVVCLPLPALYSTSAARIAPAVMMTTAVVVSWFLARGIDRREIKPGVLPFAAVAAILGSIMLATGFAEDRSSAFREFTNWCILIGFLVVATDEIIHSPKLGKTIALLIAFTVAACGVAAALESIGVLPARFSRPGSAFNRAAGGFGWPNELGMFIAIALPFAVFARSVAQSTATRLLATVGLGASLVGLLATFSRGSWLAAFAAPLVLVLVGERRLVLRAWAVGIAAAVVLDFATGGSIRDRILSTPGDWVLEQRIGLTYAGVLMFGAHPLVGVGPGGFAASLQQYGPGITWLFDYTATAQNGYVQMAAETGAIGVAALLLFMGATFRVLLRVARRTHHSVTTGETTLRRTMLWSFTTACLVGLVEWQFSHGIGQLIMLVAAMGFAFDHRKLT